MSDRARGRWVVLVTVAVLAAACSDSTAASTTEPEPSSSTTTGSPPTSSPTDSASATSTIPARDLLPCPERGFDSPEAELAMGLNTAGFDLWRDQPVDGNLVFSPASIGHTLLMARAAADEATGRPSTGHCVFPQASRHTRRGVRSPTPSPWQMPRTRWWSRSPIESGRASHHARPRLGGPPGRRARDNPSASRSGPRQPEASRDVINAWVADQTQGLIPELLPEGLYLRPDDPRPHRRPVLRSRVAKALRK